MTLEICANSIHSAINAQNAGAQRIELCENLNEGGTTPSYGTIVNVKEQLTIEIYVLIRPRSGDFLYSEEEFKIMKSDIELCKKLKCNGVVLGILTANGEVDFERTSELVQLASPMGVTFHRAFDRCNDPFKALESIIKVGCERILTSGLKKSAANSVTLIRDLIKAANNRILIMPGSGINSNNIYEIMKFTKATEVHSSAKAAYGSLMTYQNAELNNNNRIVSNEREIKKMLAQLRKLESELES